jgi:hypothetical protein
MVGPGSPLALAIALAVGGATAALAARYHTGNHAFYRLSEGSGAKTINGIAYNSPTCNGSTIKAIGHDEAAATGVSVTP